MCIIRDVYLACAHVHRMSIRARDTLTPLFCLEYCRSHSWLNHPPTRRQSVGASSALQESRPDGRAGFPA